MSRQPPRKGLSSQPTRKGRRDPNPLVESLKRIWDYNDKPSSNEDEGDEEEDQEETSLDKPKTINEYDDLLPSWHPLQLKRLTELNNGKQKSKTADFPEPIYEEIYIDYDWAKTCHKRLIESNIVPIEWTEPMIDFIASWLHLKTEGSEFKSKYVNIFVDFATQPLFYYCHLMTSEVFKHISIQTCSRNATLKIGNIPFKTNHQFYVGLIIGNHTVQSYVRNFVTSIQATIKNQFIGMTADEEKSVGTTMRKGSTFFVFGWNKAGNAKHIVGAILFHSDEHGIWVNWLAVTNKDYKKVDYGDKALNKHF